MAVQFAGKCALLTGAGSGIGRATAELMAREGATELVLIDLDSQSLGDLELGCRMRCHVGDVSDESLWEATALGEIDYAVINAGVASSGAISSTSFAQWRKILSVNLDGAFLTLRAALGAMRDGGSIVVVASAAGIKAEAGIAPYAASKAGTIQLARVAAKEAALRNIRVNVIAPGGVKTPLWDEIPMFKERAAEIGREAAFSEMAATATLLQRYAEPEEIAQQIAFLLSDACRSVTGTVFLSDGGYTL